MQRIDRASLAGAKGEVAPASSPRWGRKVHATRPDVVVRLVRAS